MRIVPLAAGADEYKAELKPREGQTMKAIYFESFCGRDVLKYGDMPEPQLRAGELLIAVWRSSINYVDIRERQGTYNRAETRVGGIELPHISGLQAVGRVVAAGSEHGSVRRWLLTRLKVGHMRSSLPPMPIFASRFKVQTMISMLRFPRRD